MFRNLSRAVVTACCCWALTSSATPAAQPLGLSSDLARDPEARGFADLLFANGMVQLADGDPASALEHFAQAAAIRPDDATYDYFAGVCLLDLGRNAEAVQRLEAGLPPATNRAGEARVRFALGRAEYARGRFDAAETHLRRGLELEDGDAAGRYFLGLTLFAGGRVAEALPELERAMRMAPELERDGAYYAGIAAYYRGDLTRARTHFEAAAAGAADPALRAGGRHWLDALETAAPPAGTPRGELRLSLLYEHDENPGQISEIFVPDIEPDSRGVLQLRGAVHPLIDASGWTLGLVLHAYASHHRDFDRFDLLGGQGIVQAAWGADPLGYLNGPLGYARVGSGRRRIGFVIQAGTSYLDADDRSFQRHHELAASLFVAQHGFGKTQLELHYDDRTFFPAAVQPYSGHKSSARLGQYFVLGDRPDRYLRVALGYGTHSTREPGLDRDEKSLLTELALPLTTRWNGFIDGAYSVIDYDDASATRFTIPEPREDTWTRLGASAVFTANAHGFLTLRYAYLDRDVDPSLLVDLGYDRSILSVGYTWHW